MSSHKGPITQRMHTRIRRKLPRARRMLSRMAASGCILRSTSRYSANASITISQMPGRKYSDSPIRISSVLTAVSKAKRGHRLADAANRSRVRGDSPRLRASRNRIRAAV
ncbi:hypothetical protein D3C81_1969840 [compost metagenome]